MIKLSGTGKMPCKSWSLQAIETCPASMGSDGELVDACKGCYATTGMYHMPNVKAPRAHNKDDWKRDAWVSDFVSLLSKETYFRWFDSGDVYSLGLANKIYAVMKSTPHVKHWLPTRMAKFGKFKLVLAKMNKLPNVVVRKSSDSISGGKLRGMSSTIVANENQAKGATVCPAYTQKGKCLDCRQCWDKSIRVIAYPQHGAKMAKVNRDIIAIAA